MFAVKIITTQAITGTSDGSTSAASAMAVSAFRRSLISTQRTQKGNLS
jgi:hypothetical protein